MAFDPEVLLRRPPIVVRQSITPETCILYALGIGADELDFVYERRLRALPSMATVLGAPGFMWRDPALGVDWQKILHGEQSIQLHAALPTQGEVIGETRIEAVYDRGLAAGAVAILSRLIRDGLGQHLATVRQTLLLRGNGGFGGSATGLPYPATVPAERKPDAIHTLCAASNLALIYRLSGDRNPLHIDPDIARAAGFARPLLHGLATYGIVARSLLAVLMNQATDRLLRMDARFSSPVYPGDTIRTEIWKDGSARAHFRAWCVEREKLVIDNGLVEYR